jgi:hypothetical protein
MKKRYTIEIEVDETGGKLETCEGCWEMTLNSSPNTREEKPIKVLAVRGSQAITPSEIRSLIIERGLTLRKVIDAASSLMEFTLVGLENFDRNIIPDAKRRAAAL